MIWDGNDYASKKAAEGEYQAIVTAKYLNGYEPDVVRSPNIVLDTTAPAARIKASSLTFSPDGDGNLDVLEITQNIAANSGSPIENWTGKIVDENGNRLTGMKIANFGSALSFLQSRTGFMICIIIPLALFFIWQIYKLISMFMTAKAENLSKESKQRVIEEYIAQQNKESSQEKEDK